MKGKEGMNKKYWVKLLLKSEKVFGENAAWVVLI